MNSVEPQVRAGLRAQWSFRAHAENEATQRFRGLSTRLRANGIGGEVLALASKAVADEERHRESCALEARRWGAPKPSFAPVCLPAPRTGRGAARDLEFEVVTLCCVAETINSIYLSEIVCSASDDTLRSVTRTILKDEVQHSRLGWLFLQRSGADLDWLSDSMPRILECALHEELAEGGSANAVTSPSHGLYSGADLLALFTACVRDVVLPGLANFGLDTGPAHTWLAKREAHTDALERIEGRDHPRGAGQDLR